MDKKKLIVTPLGKPQNKRFQCRAMETLKAPRSTERSDAPHHARELWPGVPADRDYGKHEQFRE